MLELIEQDYCAIQYTGNDIKSNEAFLLKAITINPEVMKFLPGTLLQNKEFSRKAVLANENAINFIDPSIKNSKLFKLSILSSNAKSKLSTMFSFSSSPTVVKTNHYAPSESIKPTIPTAVESPSDLNKVQSSKSLDISP